MQHGQSLQKTRGLLVIDPQKDFCDPKGSLFVPGADEDMRRLAAWVLQHVRHLGMISVTLDSHRNIDVGHPAFWRDSAGNHPGPFTVITAADIANGVYTPGNLEYRDRMLSYAKTLETQGNYPLMVWPTHCVIGSWGHGIQDDLFVAMTAWEKHHFTMVNYEVKGTNPFTEHYSAIKAEVVDPQDPKTDLNIRIIQLLDKVDCLYVGGEALSHCVMSTVKDIINNISPDLVQKIILLTDTSSSVPSFEAAGNDFITWGVARGMKTALTTDPLLA